MSTDESRVEQLQAERKAELTPAQYQRVVQLTLAVEAAATDAEVRAMDALVEGIAQHFGPLAPLIRALADHVAPDELEATCRDGCTHPWPRTGQYARD